MKHFHTLDALRFYAFFIVFIHHLPISIDSYFSKITKSGGIGVQIFFLLSGFLITYILFHEKLNKKKFSLKNFMMRRILRIWPLYYAMVFFAFITPTILQVLSMDSSGDGYAPNWLYPLLFLENYQMMLTNSFANVSPLRVMWSLCIEEHFYIIWGLAFLLLPMKRILYFLIGSIFFSFVSRLIYYKIGLIGMDIFTNIHYFSFGGILAYVLLFKPEWIEKLAIFSTILKRVIAFFILTLLLFIPNFKLDFLIIEPLIISLLTILLLALTLPEKNALKISDHNIINRLGKYTYGMYLFHTIWINLFNKFTNQYLLIALFAFVATILSSILSYHIFEKQFLKLKKYYR